MVVTASRLERRRDFEVAEQLISENGNPPRRLRRRNELFMNASIKAERALDAHMMLTAEYNDWPPRSRAPNKSDQSTSTDGLTLQLEAEGSSDERERLVKIP